MTKPILHAEDVIEKPSTDNTKDVGHADILKPRWEDMTDGHAKPEAEEEKEPEEWATWKMLPEGNNKLLNFIFIFLKILTFLTFF